MTKSKLTSIGILTTIVFGALFASQFLAAGMQGNHDGMGQMEMDTACAVHCFLAATDDVEVAVIFSIVAAAIISFVLVSQIPKPQQFQRLVPVQVSYRDPRQILTIQKIE